MNRYVVRQNGVRVESWDAERNIGLRSKQRRRAMLRKLTTGILLAASITALAGCGNTTGSRALTGGAIGAGGGAIIGGATGLGAGTGALIGAGAGALTGAATTPNRN
jgi:osmotically inducible lipoprotein OsmB